MSQGNFSSYEDLAPLGGVQALHALIDTVPDAMIVIDQSATILTFSKGAEHMFGYVEAEVIGKNVNLLMPSPDREQHDGYLKRYRDTGEKRIIGTGRTTNALRRDGSSFPINLSVGELKLNSGDVYIGFIRDLTKARATEDELQNLQAELAHVSRISSMGELATSIAHELNQPLTAVTNYAQTASELLKDPDPDNIELVRDALNECAAEAMRAAQIVQRLRKFISHGQTIRQEYSVNQLVKEATALALINGDARGVDFSTMLNQGNDLVRVDPVQIQQVLVNLIRNALEAMDDSSVKRLIISSEVTNQPMIRISISDSGPGLEPHIAERLFHPFVSTKPSGLGLGLSICYTIINSHGGRIWAEPSDIGGTTFHFTLPTTEPEQKHD